VPGGWLNVKRLESLLRERRKGQEDDSALLIEITCRAFVDIIWRRSGRDLEKRERTAWQLDIEVLQQAEARSVAGVNGWQMWLVIA
jgi:hypothetical protein